MKLPPCVYLKHGSYWYVKRGKWTNLGQDEAGALKEHARLVAEPPGGMAGLVDEALAFIKDEVKPSTFEQYLGVGRVIKRKLADFSPEQVKPVHVMGIKKSLKATPNYANRVMSVLRRIFDYALGEERIDSNPAIGITRYPEPKRTRLITIDEWIAIYWCAGSRLQAIMRLEYLTGQRIRDVLEIPLDRLTSRGIEFDQGKTGAKLTVRWSPDLRAAVEDAKALLDGRPSLTLFRSAAGGSPDYRSVHEQWARACNLAGVEDARPNDQRAQSATATKKQGKNATALLGHTNERMTDRYLRDRDRPEAEGPHFH